mgnify:CR=1 FL=1
MVLTAYQTPQMTSAVKTTKRPHGFTLLEIVMVLAIAATPNRYVPEAELYHLPVLKKPAEISAGAALYDAWLDEMAAPDAEAAPPAADARTLAAHAALVLCLLDMGAMDAVQTWLERADAAIRELLVSESDGATDGDLQTRLRALLLALLPGGSSFSTIEAAAEARRQQHTARGAGTWLCHRL